MPECTKPAEDMKTPDPGQNIYHCIDSKCDKFHRSVGDKILIDAIYFLQVDRVRELLDTLSIDKIKSMQMTFGDINEISQNLDSEKLEYFKTKIWNRDLLSFVFANLISWCWSKNEYPTMDNA